MQGPVDIPSNWPLRHIPFQRRLPLGAVVLPLVLLLAMACYVLLVALPHFVRLAHETDGLIHPGLVVGLISQLLLVFGFLFGICKLRPRELGLDVRKLPIALVVTAAAWAACQGLQAALAWFAGQEIAINPVWTGSRWEVGNGFGDWLKHLLANDPNEEMIFRGFLLPQLVAQLVVLRPSMKPWLKVSVALLVSQAAFALFHVPAYWVNKHMELLPAAFIVGLLWAGIYLRTGNLFLTMGVHTLFNCAAGSPPPLVKTHLAYGDFIVVGLLVLVILLPLNRLFRRDKRMKGHDLGTHIVAGNSEAPTS